jgi:hypothetical protein
MELVIWIKILFTDSFTQVRDIARQILAVSDSLNIHEGTTEPDAEE